MKKTRVLALCLVLMAALALSAFAGCELRRVNYTVTFSQDGVVLKEFNLRQDELISESEMPGTPQKPGYAFDGWFEGETQFDPTQPVNRDANFEAKFTQLFDLTFVSEGQTVAEFTEVRKGETLPADQIPAQPDKAGYDFDGWFNGEVWFDFEAPVSVGGTFEAVFTKLYTVRFVNGEETVSEVTVREGETIPESAIPGDLSGSQEMSFAGWFNGETEFDDLAPITTDVTYTAKFERIAYALTFGETVVYVPVSDPELTADQIPAAPAGTGVFLGWYKDGVKLEAGVTVTGNAAYEAVFVTEADYLGVWADTVNHLSVIVTEEGVTFGEGDLSDVMFTFDATTGSMVYEDESSYYPDSYTLTAVKDVLILNHQYYDTTYEEMVDESYTLTRCGSFELAGNYLNGTTKLVVLDGGILASFGSNDRYGRLYQEGENWKLEYYASSYTSTLTVADVTVDERGNLVVSNASSQSDDGIYVKAESGARYEYYRSGVGSCYLYAYTTADGTVFVFQDLDKVQSYAEVEGTVAEGEILTLAVNGQSLIAKITGERNFELAGDERGVYTGPEGELTLDGFDLAVLGEEELPYTRIGSIVIVENIGYELNLQDKTYTVAQAVEGGISGYYRLDDSSYYSVTFYDFGVLIFVYTSSWSGDTLYPGTYTVSGGEIVIEDIDYNIDGNWKVEADGNVLTEVGGDAIYIKDGYEIVSQIENFEGWFVDEAGNYVSFSTAVNTVTYRGQTVTFTANYNGSVLTFTAVDEGSYYEDSEAEFTATVSDGTLTIVFTRLTGWDDVYEDYLTETVTETYTATEEPVIELDAFAGKWVDGNSNTYLFDGMGTVQYNGTQYAYTVSDQGVASFYNGSYTITCTLTGDKTMTANFQDDYGEENFNQTATFVEKDVFTGSWMDDEDYYQYVLQFDGYGTITITSLKYPGNSWYNGTSTYTISGNVATFELLDYTWTCTLNDDGTLSVTTIDYDGYSGPEGTYTNRDKGEEADVDAFAGTWTGKVGANSYTVVCDGKGNVTVNDVDYTYQPGSVTIEVGNGDFTITITMNDDGTMHVVYYDEWEMFELEGDLTKTA